MRRYTVPTSERNSAERAQQRHGRFQHAGKIAKRFQQAVRYGVGIPPVDAIIQQDLQKFVIGQRSFVRKEFVAHALPVPFVHRPFLCRKQSPENGPR